MLARDARLLSGEPLVGPEALEALSQHAREAYPQECIGAILRDGSYRRLENASSSPDISAWPAPGVLLELLNEGVRALCHSHPNGPDAPSEQDMIAQSDLEIPFIIVSTDGSACLPAFAWGDQLQPMPLLGRPFRHGVSDCYSLIRGYYQLEMGISLGDYPRNWEWWKDATPGSKDLYRRYFSEEGFRQTDPTSMEVGDVWLAAIRSDVPNHAGIYVGDGLVLHHSSARLAYDPARLSRREPLARWLPYITHWLRR